MHITGSPQAEAEAFYKWREARLKAEHKRQLQQILGAVSAEELAKRQLHDALKKAHTREQDLLLKLSQLKGELSTAAEQLLAQQATADNVQAVLDAYDSQVLAPLAQHLADAQGSQAAQVQQHQHAQEAQQQALHDLKQEQLHLLQEHHQLLNALSRKEEENLKLVSVAASSHHAAAATQQKLSALELVLCTAREQAAAAKQAAKQSNDAVIELRQHLDGLEKRYHEDLAHMQSLRSATAGSAVPKNCLREASAAASVLAASVQHLKGALEEVRAGLAAATEHCRHCEGAKGCSRLVCSMVDAGEGSLAAALPRQLGAAQAQQLAHGAQCAAVTEVAAQKQQHLQQLSARLCQADAAQAAAEEQARMLQVLDVQLQAGLQQQAVLAGSQSHSATLPHSASLEPRSLNPSLHFSPVQAEGSQPASCGHVPELAALQPQEGASLSLKLDYMAQGLQEVRGEGTGNTELVPAELLAAARTSHDEAVTQVAALAQNGQEQAAAQQVAAATFVQRVALQRQVTVQRCAWLRWQLLAANNKAERRLLELEATQAQLNHQQQHATAHMQALRTFFKHQVRAATAVMQQQVATAVLRAWRHQGVQQQRATRAWRSLADKCLQHQQRGQGLPLQCQCRQQQGVPLKCTRITPRGNAGPQGVSLPSLMGGCDCRRAVTQGCCKAAVAAHRLLTTAFRSWHMLASLRICVKAVQQAESHSEALSVGLPDWIGQLDDRRRLERTWLGWRLVAHSSMQQHQEQVLQHSLARPDQRLQVPIAAAATPGPPTGVCGAAPLTATCGVTAMAQQAAAGQIPCELQQHSRLEAPDCRFAALPRWMVKLPAPPVVHTAAHSTSEPAAPAQGLSPWAPVTGPHVLSEMVAALSPDCQELQGESGWVTAFRPADDSPQLPTGSAAGDGVSGVWEGIVEAPHTSLQCVLDTDGPKEAAAESGQQQGGADSLAVTARPSKGVTGAATQPSVFTEHEGPLIMVAANDIRPCAAQLDLAAAATSTEPVAQQPQQQGQPLLPCDVALAADSHVQLQQGCTAPSSDTRVTNAQKGPASKANGGGQSPVVKRPQQKQHRPVQPARQHPDYHTQQQQQQQHKIRLRTSKAGNSATGGSKQAATSSVAHARLHQRTRPLSQSSQGRADGITATTGTGTAVEPQPSSRRQQDSSALHVVPRQTLRRVDSSPPPSHLAVSGVPAAGGGLASSTAGLPAPAQLQAVQASQVCGRFAGIANRLAALQQHVAQQGVAISPAGHVGTLQLEQQPEQSATTAVPRSGVTLTCSHTERAGGGHQESVGAGFSCSPIKLAAADVQSRLLDYQQHLLLLKSNLHTAARPWAYQSSSINTSIAARAPIAAPATSPVWSHLSALVVRPQSPEATCLLPAAPHCAVQQLLMPAGGGLSGLSAVHAEPAAAASVESAEWRVVGQPRRSALTVSHGAAAVGASVGVHEVNGTQPRLSCSEMGQHMLGATPLRMQRQQQWCPGFPGVAAGMAQAPVAQMVSITGPQQYLPAEECQQPQGFHQQTSAPSAVRAAGEAAVQGAVAAHQQGQHDQVAAQSQVL